MNGKASVVAGESAYERAERNNGLTRDGRKQSIRDWMIAQDGVEFTAREIADGQGVKKSTHIMKILHEMCIDQVLNRVEKDYRNGVKFFYSLLAS